MDIIEQNYQEALDLNKIKNAEKRSKQKARALTDMEALINIWQAEYKVNKDNNEQMEMARLAKLIDLARKKFDELISLENKEAEEERQKWEQGNQAKVLPLRRK